MEQAGSGRRGLAAARLDQAARAAWLYYVGGRTQDEIAVQLGVSRQAAQRLVSLAVAEKLIKFRLDHPVAACMALSEALIARHRLRYCEIVPTDPMAADALPALATAGAAFLERWLQQRAPAVLALSTGQTLRAIVDQVSPMHVPQHKVMSLCGTLGVDGRSGSAEPVMRLAERTGAQCYPMPAPVIAASIEERQQFQAQRPFRTLTELLAQARCALVGVGEIAWQAPLHAAGFIDDHYGVHTSLLRRGLMFDSVSWVGIEVADGRFAGAVRGPPPGKRGALLLARLLEGGGRAVCVRRLGGRRAGEIQLTRLLRNERVTTDEMIAEAAQRTADRCRGREVLVIQDTTVTRSDGGGGDYLHVALAVDGQDGAILGLVDGQFLSRPSGTAPRGKALRGGTAPRGRTPLRRDAPVEEKESFRWLQAADQAASVCAGAAAITVMSDREGDIYEAFALRPHGVDLLVRAAQDRSLDDGGRLFAALDAQPQAGRAAIDLPAQPGRKRRTAVLAVRFATLCLARPNRSFRAGLPAAVTLQAVDAREIDPPPGEPAVHWRLLTTRPVADVAEAWAVTERYRKRWAIEQLFRTLKTHGFDIEALRIEDRAPRDKLIAATLIAAVAIQQLVHARDGGPGPLRPCTDVFEPADMPLLRAFCRTLEGKTQRQKNPHPEASLAYAAWVCARLGGWTGYYGKPGPVVMLRGWLEIQAAKRGIVTLCLNHDV